jgi:hypothetical protein
VPVTEPKTTRLEGARGASVIPLPGGPIKAVDGRHGPLVIGVGADASPEVRAAWLGRPDAPA